MAKKVFHLIFLSVACIVTAQLMIKYGLQHTQEVSLTTIIPFFQTLMQNHYVLLGITLSLISAALWLMVLSKAELSYAYPSLSLAYVLTAIGSWLLFNENLNALRAAGIIIACTGVFALSKS